jgi:hypothetical protein
MSSMNVALCIPDKVMDGPAAKPFVLYRDHVRPALEARRVHLDAMYSSAIGRPEIDPVFLMGVTQLQILEQIPDRQTVDHCMFDLRWRLALGIPDEWKGIHPSTLSTFRSRLAEHDQARLALDVGLDAMRRAGYLGKCNSVRIDSTHVLAEISAMSRLECVRETLRLALDFLTEWGGPTAWEPWVTRYAERYPVDLRKALVPKLKTTMEQAGTDMRDVLVKTATLGTVVMQSQPVVLLQQVFDEQFENRSEKHLKERRVTPAGSVHNPHDPEAHWCTKKSLGKVGWVGYKLQLCETAPEQTRAKGEPTEAVITVVLTQPATTSDHGSLSSVIVAQTAIGESPPEIVFTDAGYISAPALENAETRGYELCGPMGAPPHSGSRFGSDAFTVDIPNRRATCPVGKQSSECSRITETGVAATYYYFAWARTDCLTCPLAVQCLSKKKIRPFRTLQVGERHMLVQARRLLCRTPEYQARMRRRNAIEGTNSEVKRGLGVRKCRYHGRAKTNVQMQLSGAACNLRRWASRTCWLARRIA